MARCPFAKWHPINGAGGIYTGGPFRIVHHTTEGGSAEGAFTAFRANRDEPHFTLDETTIYQHIDTAESARSLGHHGPPETNRLSAVQIEVVGFAAQPKSLATLLNIARLCRWIETTHDVPKVWPDGLPARSAAQANAPGFRDATIWSEQGGHYGHCHVPNNTHWDPGYSVPEVHILLQEIGVTVNGDNIAEAGGFLDATDHSFAWIRPIATAIQADIIGLTVDSITLQRGGVQQTIPANVLEGYAFAALGALRNLPGVQVNFNDETSTVEITTS